MHKSVVLIAALLMMIMAGERVPSAAPREAIAGEVNKKPFTARHAYLYYSRRFVFLVDGDLSCQQMLPTDKIPDGTRYVLLFRTGERELSDAGFYEVHNGHDTKLAEADVKGKLAGTGKLPDRLEIAARSKRGFAVQGAMTLEICED